MADHSTKANLSTDKEAMVCLQRERCDQAHEITRLTAQLETSKEHYERLVKELSQSRDQWREVVITLSYPEGSFPSGSQ